MKYDVLAAAKVRRSIYALGKEIPVSEERIQEIVEEAVKHAPSPFNSQSAKAVIMFGKAHDELWDHTLEVLRGMVKDPEALKATESKIAAFKGAYGSVLFFEDQSIVEGLQANFPLYSQKFPLWSIQASGMAQYLVWTALAQEGVGANLQHYDPLIDEWVIRKTGVPASWKLMSQMTFGKILAPAGEKTFVPIEERVRVMR